MNEQIFKKISGASIFLGCDPKLLTSVLESENCKIKSFSSGETICEAHSVLRSIGIILSGSAVAMSQDRERNVLLRRFAQGDIFGVSGVFGEDEKFVTRISAKGPCSVAFISANGLRELIENDKNVLYNYIGFLSDRIRFLNKKIKFFTSGSAERRLALYLDSFGEDEFTIEESMSALAEMLDIGRASLYRAFDSLTADGFIIRDKDKIHVLNREKMINYYNER
ncbi:MAG: Crp/Fnr family transcriptional regulator [Ruminococcaceae bacterium]|nr:Crp/Fnr family transcriptional regulator [Oscillospiraceae bacterium]